MHLGNDSFSRIASSTSIRSDVTHIICPSSHGNNVFAEPGQGSSASTAGTPTPRRRHKRPSSPANIAFDNLSSVSDRPGPWLGHTHPHTHAMYNVYVSYRVVSYIILIYCKGARARMPPPIFITSCRTAGRCVISPIFPPSPKRITRPIF